VPAAGGDRTYSLVYLGQCLAGGHEPDTGNETYPLVTRRYVEAARPGLRLETTILFYDSPYVDLDFKSDLALRARPDVLVLDVPARPVAYATKEALDLRRFPRGVRSVYQRARHLRELNELLRLPPGVGPLVQLADVGFRAVLEGPLRHLVRRYPTPSLHEYALLVEGAVERLKARTTATLVLSGPGGFTEAGSGNGYADDAKTLYDAVNDLARQIAERHHLLFIDRVAAAAGAGPSFFQPGSSIHYSRDGHVALGRFLGDLLLTHGVL
jgi:hypothetical protein